MSRVMSRLHNLTVDLAASDTEVEVELPENAYYFRVKCRQTADLQIAFSKNKTDGGGGSAERNFYTIPAGQFFECPFPFHGPRKFYLSSPVGSVEAEIIYGR